MKNFASISLASEGAFKIIDYYDEDFFDTCMTATFYYSNLEEINKERDKQLKAIK